MYEGALPDVMLSDNFLNTIPSVTTPGHRLIDTWEYVGDRDILRQYIEDTRGILVHHMRSLSSKDAAASHACSATCNPATASSPPSNTPPSPHPIINLSTFIE
jgi:hypothetical protein